MEVHHHSHSSRKKWTHYFWEFLMLFLAVTLGFFVENQREHYIEHQREKTFMQSMTEDVKKDSAMLSGMERAAKNVTIYIDTMLAVLQNPKPEGASLAILYRANLRSLAFFGPNFTDRTSSQLKNSGAMRIIRNRNVADSIISYWNQIDQIVKTNDQAEEYKMKARDRSYSIFDQRYYINRGSGAIGINDPYPRLMTEDNMQLTEYANRLAHIRNLVTNVYLPMIIVQKQKAKNLIEEIKKEYRLE